MKKLPSEIPAGWPVYRIIRFYQNGAPARTIKTGLSLIEAQAHCNNPETSSSTATSSKARAYTRTHGQWFDGYDLMKGYRQ